MTKIQSFDPARRLDTPEVISHYLTEAFATGDSKLILRAIQNVARANKMSKIARKAGMSRTSLYWKDNTSPEFTTVLKVLDAVAVRLVPIMQREAGTGRKKQPARKQVVVAGKKRRTGSKE